MENTNPNPNPTPTYPNKPLLANGNTLINPALVAWANLDTTTSNGRGVTVLFTGDDTDTEFTGGDAQSVASILIAASQEAPDAV